jgi:hypothetical protein
VLHLNNWIDSEELAKIEQQGSSSQLSDVFE